MEKGSQYTALLYGLVAIFEINKTVFLWFFGIMAFDMVFGALKSVMIPDLAFSTRKFYFGAMRKLTLVGLVLFIATLVKGFGYSNPQTFTTYAMKILMITEGISVLYCFKSIFKGKEYKSDDFISVFITAIIKYLGDKLTNIVKSMNENNSCF